MADFLAPGRLGFRTADAKDSEVRQSASKCPDSSAAATSTPEDALLDFGGSGQREVRDEGIGGEPEDALLPRVMTYMCLSPARSTTAARRR